MGARPRFRAVTRPRMSRGFQKGGAYEVPHSVSGALPPAFRWQLSPPRRSPGTTDGQTADGMSGQRLLQIVLLRGTTTSQEVLKKTKDVDHTRTIETQSVVPSKRLIETNHLIVHEDETRNIGTVQHNHTIVEKGSF